MEKIMGLIKRKASAVLEGDDVPPPAPDLAGEILKLRGQIEAFIDSKVMELKSGRDGASIPIDFLRHQLTGGETSCHCRAALRVLADESDA
jgi:hypothetical protein